MKRILASALALLLATPTIVLAQTVPTSTARTPSIECLRQAQNDFKSAWQQDWGNPYYDTWEANTADNPRNGISDTMEGTYAFMVAARACTFRQAAAPVSVPDSTALAAERARALSDARAALAAVR